MMLSKRLEYGIYGMLPNSIINKNLHMDFLYMAFSFNFVFVNYVHIFLCSRRSLFLMHFMNIQKLYLSLLFLMGILEVINLMLV